MPQMADIHPNSGAAGLPAQSTGAPSGLPSAFHCPMLKPTVGPMAGTSTMEANPIPSTTRPSVSIASPLGVADPVPHGLDSRRGG